MGPCVCVLAISAPVTHNSESALALMKFQIITDIFRFITDKYIPVVRKTTKKP